MKTIHCVICKKKYHLKDDQQLLMCSCGAKEDYELIEIDSKGFPVKKEVKK